MSCNCNNPCSCNHTPNCCEEVANRNCIPYYQKDCAVQEQHAQVIMQQQYAGGLSTSSTFNMPACGQTGVMTIPGLQTVVIGSYLWNPTYGYLEVVSFDFANSSIVVKNNCQPGNAAAGTLVPACTLFVLTVSPDALFGDIGPATYYPYVAVDFTVPAVGMCLDITVTTTAGLSVNSIVQIGSGVYRVASIVSSTVIRICNDGDGAVPGSIVTAKDSLGNFIVPIITTDTNICNSPENTQGSLIVCRNGISRILQASGIGQLPVVVDAATNEVQFQTVPFEDVFCTTLTGCWNIVSGTSEYIILVEDTSGFIQWQGIELAPISGAYSAVISEIISATEMRVLVVPAPSSTFSIEAGETVCAVTCCEQFSRDTSVEIFNVTQDMQHVGTILDPTVGGEIYTDTIQFLVTNPTTKFKTVIMQQRYIVSGYALMDGAAQWIKYFFDAQRSLTTGAIGTTVAPIPSGWVGGKESAYMVPPYAELNEGAPYTDEITPMSLFSIAPGQELRVAARTYFKVYGTVPEFEITGMRTFANVHIIAL